MCGIIEGTSLDAARERVQVPEIDVEGEWFKSQTEKLFSVAENIGEELACQQLLIGSNTYKRDGPLVLFNREILSVESLLKRVKENPRINIILKRSYRDENYEVQALKGAGPIFNADIDEERVHFLVRLPGDFEEDLDWEDFLENDDGVFSQIISEVKKEIGPEAKITSQILEDDDVAERRKMRVDIFL